MDLYTPDPKDKIFILETTGKADINKIYEEMRAEDTGLRPETIVHVVTLFERICARLLMNGWQLNTGLFYAVPRLLGLAEDGRWNPEKNGVTVLGAIHTFSVFAISFNIVVRHR